MKFDENEIKRKCVDRGMKYNSLTRYLVLHRMTAYRLSKLLNVPQPTISRACHEDEKDLASWCSALFRTLNKLDLMGVQTEAVY